MSMTSQKGREDQTRFLKSKTGFFESSLSLVVDRWGYCQKRQEYTFLGWRNTLQVNK